MKSNSLTPVPVPGAVAAVNSVTVTPPAFHIPPSSPSPSLRGSPPSPTPQQTRNDSSNTNIPAPQLQLATVEASQQCPPEDLVTASGPDGADEQQQSPRQATSLDDPPGTRTTEFAPGDGLDEAITNPGPFPDDPDHSQRLPGGALSYCGSSAFITDDAIRYLQAVRAGQCWTTMVTAFLRLEELPQPLGVRIFPVLLARLTDKFISPPFILPLGLNHGRTRCLSG